MYWSSSFLFTEKSPIPFRPVLYRELGKNYRHEPATAALLKMCPDTKENITEALKREKFLHLAPDKPRCIRKGRFEYEPTYESKGRRNEDVLSDACV